LTECSAILKYLADKAGAAQYPKDLQARARVNERMDWVNTQLSRELCYSVVYPQIFDFMKKRSEKAQAAHIEWGKQKAQNWLQMMNDALIGTENPYLCGAAITIADYFAASHVALGELTGSNYSAYPNVKRWLDRMKSLKSWNQVYETVNGFGKTLDRRSMIAA
jgi:glutathione S-transferase